MKGMRHIKLASEAWKVARGRTTVLTGSVLGFNHSVGEEGGIVVEDTWGAVRWAGGVWSAGSFLKRKHQDLHWKF